MGKRLFLLLFIGLMGISLTPDFLSADDYFPIKNPEFHAVETKIPEPEPVPEPAPEPVKIIVRQTAAKQAATAAITPPTPQKVNYTVSYYVGSPAEFNSIALNLSYNGLYKYRKMIYGHNSGNLLGNLSNRKVGEIITITENGIVKNYQIASIRTFRKTEDQHLENDPNLMTNIANTALGHDIALFTCAGRVLGKSGDATHRLVVFANQI